MKVPPFISPDRVALTGSAIGSASLLADWLVLKPNRLAAGTGLGLWAGYGTVAATFIACLWLLCLCLSLVKTGQKRCLWLGLVANLLLVMILVFTGLAARDVLASQEEIARLSLSAGFWMSLGSSYILLYATRHRLPFGGWRRNTIAWGWLPILVVLLATGWLDNLSILREFDGYQQRFVQELWQHVRLFAISVSMGALIGIPLGIWANRNRHIEKPVLYTTGMLQTVPSLALFGLLIAPLSALSFSFPLLRDLGIRGIGFAPAIIALTVYSLLPIVRNTFVGLRQVDRAAIDAGLGMGMSRRQVFLKVEAPLAAPLILEGCRTASIQAVGLATVAALIGAGGLGWFVFRGIGQAAPDLILLGAIPIIVLALLVDALMRILIKIGTPAGLREKGP